MSGLVTYIKHICNLQVTNSRTSRDPAVFLPLDSVRYPYILKFLYFCSSPSLCSFLLSAVKQSLVKTRMFELRVQRKSFARILFSLMDDKARDHFSVAEGVRAMTYSGHEPLERLTRVFVITSFLETDLSKLGNHFWGLDSGGTVLPAGRAPKS